MDESKTVNDLTYLAGYLKESRARIESLQQELEDQRNTSLSNEIQKRAQYEAGIRGLLSEHKAQLQALKEDNVVLRQWNATLDSTLTKVKKENAVRVNSSSYATTMKRVYSLQDDEASVLHAERSAKQDLENKCKALESRVKEVNELAARAMCEKVDVEKALDAMRTDYQAANKKAGELQRVSDRLSSAEYATRTTQEEANAELRSQFEALRSRKKEQSEQLKKRCGELVRYDAREITTERDVLRGEYDKKVEEVKMLQKTVVTHRRRLGMSGREDSESEDSESEGSESGDSESEGSESEDSESEEDEAVDTPNPPMEMEKTKFADAQDAYKQFMLGLPTVGIYPMSFVKPVASKKTNLRGYLGQTRANDSFLYLGTYHCHRLNAVFPGGAIPPPTISVKELTNATFPGGRPSWWPNILRQQFPSGTIRVEAMGLNLVGFNAELYNALLARFEKRKRKAANDGKKAGRSRSSRKRKAANDGNDAGSKSRKLNSEKQTEELKQMGAKRALLRTDYHKTVRQIETLRKSECEIPSYLRQINPGFQANLQVLESNQRCGQPECRIKELYTNDSEDEAELAGDPMDAKNSARDSKKREASNDGNDASSKSRKLNSGMTRRSAAAT
ncbi:hypothetical protein FB45DRAFT_1038393 [Roridomyces roridus]|uniref:Uncharacterized protein n=1 Tax=Roridomyces roridus TaxID=1738132 RepID=A0AAD7F953_9AGAR|nr:hypothetical protein FB45DRAFT_1038393 [Roridomyces roridus]